jgi:hypothetical protein
MTNQSIRALYGSLVAMTLKLDDALSQKLNAEGFLPVALVAELAEEHALQYQLKTGACFFAVAANGGYRFYTSEEAISANKHTGAQKQWDRCIAEYHDIKKDKRGGKRDKKEVVVPRRTKRVTELLVMFHDLNAAERAAFFAAVPKRD